MKARTTKKAIVCVTALIVLTLGFYDNTWKVVDSRSFENFADITESFIIGRLAESRQSPRLSSSLRAGIRIEQVSVSLKFLALTVRAGHARVFKITRERIRRLMRSRISINSEVIQFGEIGRLV